MANISSKHPDYNKEFETGDIDLFKPEFKRDSKGSYFMQLPGYGKWMVSNTPGSKIISQGSEKEDGSAATNPDSLSSGSLSTDTVIRIGEYVYLDGDQGLIAVGDYEKRVDTSMSIGGNGFYGYSGNDLVLAFFLKANGDFDKGDAIIGDYTSDNYILWDDSAGLLYVRGDIIVEGDIESANYVAGISGYKLTYASGLAEFQEGLIGDWEIDTCLKKEYTISTPSKSKIELCPGNPGHIQVAYSPTGSFSLPGDTYMVQLTQGSTSDAGGVPIPRLDIYRDGVKRAMFNSDGLYFFNVGGDTVTSILSGATDVANFTNVDINGGLIGGQSVDNIGNVSNSISDIVPTGLTASATGIKTGINGTQLAYVTLTWDAIVSDTFDHYVIRYKIDGYTYYDYVDITTTTITINGLLPNTTYNFGIASVNKYGAVSAFSTDIDKLTATDSTLPANVAGLTALGGIQISLLNWTSNTDWDLASYNIYRNTVNSSGTATLIGNCRTNYFIDGNRTGGTLLYYWVKAVDTSGNVSAAFSTVASCTPRNVASSDANIAQAGWTQTSTFSSTDSNTVAWEAGTYTASNGVSYSISASNTDTRLTDAGLTSPMDDLVYIYLYPGSGAGQSDTEYQCVYDALDAVGDGKVLIGVANDNITEAVFQIFGGMGGIYIDGADLVAESITTNQIAANTIKAGNIEAGTITVTEIDTSTITSLSDLVIGAPQILIQGTTYFSDWLGDDAGITKIEGGNIVTGSITLNEINFVPVETDSVIASINASSEGIEINAKYITISGTTVFNSSWASASNAQSAISTSGVNNDAGWTDDAVADAAQSAAEAAQADADTANGLLTDIALDTKITPVEKLTIKPLWDDIIVEATATTGTIPAQAIIFGVAHTNFDNAYSALSTYLLTTVNVFASMTTTSTIVRADWDTAWKNYYNERTLILNAIATEAKALADTAQGDATQAIADAATAQGTADGKVTTFYADEEPTAEGTGDLWVDTNDGNKLYRWSGSAWTEIQDDDIATAIANAGTAQTTADGKIVSFYADEPPTADGVGDFWTDTNDNNKLYRWSGSAWISVRDATIATAQTAAEAAQADADTAQGELNNISSDSKITPVEKLTIKPLWDTIVTEKSSIDTQADSYSVSKTAYGTAYTNLNTYLNTTIKVFVSMTTTSTIARTTWDGYWEAYYNAKVDILNAIATATAGDMTQTFIDGGVITTGTIQVVQGGSYVAGMTGSTSGDTAVRFWAGSSFANRAAAPYRVTQGGLVTANNADIQGLIKATSGWIGGSTSGWKIDSNVLQAYSGVTKIIELSATGPHIQCLKDSNNYVQMTPASSDPRFDVFKAGIRRIRLNEDGLTFFTDAGAETNKIGLGVTDGDVTFGGGYVRLFSGGIRISYDYSGTGLNLADESTTYLRMYVAASAQSYAGTIDLPNSDILVIRDKTGPPGNKIVDFVGRTGQGNNYGLVDVYSPIGLLATSTSPTGASNGWMFYNTTYNEVWAYIGGSWEALDHGGGATGTVTSVATSGAITGGTITTTGTISHSTSNGYKHFPSSGSTYQMIRNSATGTGAWTSNLYIGGLSTYYIYRDSSSPYDTIFEVPSGTDYAFSRGGTVYTKIDDNFWTKGNLYADGQLSVGGTIQNTVGDIIINNGNLQLKKNGAIIAIDDSGGTTRYLTVQWNATLSKYILST